MGFAEGHGGWVGWAPLARGVTCGAMTITGHRTERQPAWSEPDGGARPRVGCDPYRGHRANDPPNRRNVNSRSHNVMYS